jgi:hypothetical protein
MLYGDDVATTLINYMNLHWNEYLAEMFGTAILLFSYLSSISFPFSSKTSCTLDIGMMTVWMALPIQQILISFAELH